MISKQLWLASLITLTCTACQKQPESPIQTDTDTQAAATEPSDINPSEANIAPSLPMPASPNAPASPTLASTSTAPIINREANRMATPAAQWLGEWIGPEGTYLRLAQMDGQYQLTISDLDGPKTFEATPNPTGLSFKRQGQMETLFAGSGRATGMKWLTEKQDCLIVKLGEGYCRG